MDLQLIYEALLTLGSGGSLPAGGTTGQVLKKLSDVDNDAGWRDESGGGAPVEFQLSATHIQWRNVGDPDWIDLITISAITGTNGTNGVGVPAGGTTGQVLKKKGNTDYDTGWADESGGGGEIDDAAISTTKTWSSSKISSEIGAAKHYLSLSRTAELTQPAGTNLFPFDTADSDADSIWNSSTNKITPTKAGLYLIHFRIHLTATDTQLWPQINKNGAIVKAVGDTISSGTYGRGGAVLVDMNGTTDYIEPYVNLTGARGVHTQKRTTYLTLIGPL
jgi:hypothetical protein